MDRGRGLSSSKEPQVRRPVLGCGFDAGESLAERCAARTRLSQPVAARELQFGRLEVCLRAGRSAALLAILAGRRGAKSRSGEAGAPAFLGLHIGTGCWSSLPASSCPLLAPASRRTGLRRRPATPPPSSRPVAGAASAGAACSRQTQLPPRVARSRRSSGGAGGLRGGQPPQRLGDDALAGSAGCLCCCARPSLLSLLA
jgi:hypothetical protein